MRSALAAILILVAAPVSAETLVLPAKSFSGCPKPSSRTSRVDDALATIASLTDRIERVPPADAEYLKAETEAAMAQKNEARYNLAAASRFYAPWQVWNAHRTMKASLDAVRDSDDPRVTIVGAGRALADVPGFYSALNDYLAVDRRRSPRSYDETRLHFDRAVLASSLGYLVECAAMSIEMK